MTLEFPDLKKYHLLKEKTEEYFLSPGAVKICECKNRKEDIKIQEKI